MAANARYFRYIAFLPGLDIPHCLSDPLLSSRLIINCKLHQIDYQVLQELAPGRTPPTLGHSKWDGTLLGRPKDAYELAHRIAIFWQSYYGDKTRSLMTGLPANYDETVDAHITTVWPRTLDEYISGTAFDVPYSSMDDLFDGSTPVGPLNTPFMMMFKGAALLDRAHRLTALERAPPERDIQALRDAIDTLNTSFDTLVTGTLLDHQGTPRSKSRNFCEANFRGLIMLYGLVAKIHVTYIRAFEEEEGAVEARFEERLAWASRCADVVVETTRELDAIAVGMNLGGKTPGVEHMCFMTGLLLTSASVVLVDQVHKLETAIAQIAPDTPARALLEAQLQEEEEKLDVIVGGIARVRETFPILARTEELLSVGDL
ncbi:hypothetical protein FRB99_006255 [Tulasnella sp. 403]|nr:hypothetical protein FRB99_006255 [Tulasnella sp. 403]